MTFEKGDKVLITGEGSQRYWNEESMPKLVGMTGKVIGIFGSQPNVCVRIDKKYTRHEQDYYWHPENLALETEAFVPDNLFKI